MREWLDAAATESGSLQNLATSVSRSCLSAVPQPPVTKQQRLGPAVVLGEAEVSRWIQQSRLMQHLVVGNLVADVGLVESAARQSSEVPASSPWVASWHSARKKVGMPACAPRVAGRRAISRACFSAASVTKVVIDLPPVSAAALMVSYPTRIYAARSSGLWSLRACRMYIGPLNATVYTEARTVKLLLLLPRRCGPGLCARARCGALMT